MLQKTAIILSVLMLFVGILFAQAQIKDVYHFENQYIDTLNMPWTKSAKVLETTLNEFYDKPNTAGPWDLECKDGVCQPFYIDGSDRHIIKTHYEFGTNNKLKSITSQYDVIGYTRLIERLEKDFSSGGVVRAYQYVQHVYEKDYKNAHITVNVKYTGINKPVKFSAKFETIKKKEGEKHVDEMAMAKADPITIFRAPTRIFAAYCVLLGNNVYN